MVLHRACKVGHMVRVDIRRAKRYNGVLGWNGVLLGWLNTCLSNGVAWNAVTRQTSAG